MYDRNKFISILLLLLVLLSGSNFLNQFKVASIPFFQILYFLTIIILALTVKRFHSTKLKAIRYYEYYLFFSIFPFFIGLTYSQQAIYTYVYSVSPLFLFFLTFKIIDHTYYKKLLIGLNFSMLLVTSIGWLIRLGFIDFNFFYADVIESEYALGYWGIRYLESTRNADYLYPLIGLALCIYFYIDKKNIFNLIFVFIYAFTLIASQSRTALIISALSLLLVFSLSNKRNKKQFIALLSILIVFNVTFLYNIFISEYMSILSSIFSLESTESRFSNTSRYNVLEYALTASIYNPFGYGIDNYSIIYDLYDFIDKTSYSAENAFLTILIERGWFALIFFLSALILILKKAYQRKKITLNKILIPLLFVYLFFNYELNNVFGNFIFYIVLIDYYLNTQRDSNE